MRFVLILVMALMLFPLSAQEGGDAAGDAGEAAESGDAGEVSSANDPNDNRSERRKRVDKAVDDWVQKIEADDRERRGE
ncbi:MAG: hypothetical protein ACPHUF_09915 [Gammaproteobacteria bacterium]